MIFIASTESNYITATSYLSLDEAKAMLSGDTNSSSWLSLPDEQKMLILNRCSLSIDGLFSYQHARTDNNQLLKFPRNGSTSVPAAIKHASGRLALSVSKDEAFRNVKSEKIGKMSWQYFISSNGATDEIMAYLRPYKSKSIAINQ